MAGFSDAPFRRLWPVTSARPGRSARWSRRRGWRSRTSGSARLRPVPGEPDVVVQVFAADARTRRHAVARARADVSTRRLRPQHGVPRQEGVNRAAAASSCAIRSAPPAVVAAMVAATRRPVSAKLRLGVDRFVAIEVAQAVERRGAGRSPCTVGPPPALRGRGRLGRHRRVARAVSVPVLGSGDVTDAAGYARARSRGRRGHDRARQPRPPWLFAEIHGSRRPAARSWRSWRGATCATTPPGTAAMGPAAAHAGAARSLRPGGTRARRAGPLRAALVRADSPE
jgi:tRNA-dihydrouridine synthase B